MCPVNKKGRLVGYKGLLFLSAPVKNAQSHDKKKKRWYQLHLLQSKRLRVSMKRSPRCGSLTN